MNIEDIPTPETDAAFLKLYAGYLTHPATIDLQAAEKFARNLERQKAALREALANLMVNAEECLEVEAPHSLQEAIDTLAATKTKP